MDSDIYTGNVGGLSVVLVHNFRQGRQGNWKDDGKRRRITLTFTGKYGLMEVRKGEDMKVRIIAGREGGEEGERKRRGGKGGSRKTGSIEARQGEVACVGCKLQHNKYSRTQVGERRS